MLFENEFGRVENKNIPLHHIFSTGNCGTKAVFYINNRVNINVVFMQLFSQNSKPNCVILENTVYITKHEKIKQQ